MQLNLCHVYKWSPLDTTEVLEGFAHRFPLCIRYIQETWENITLSCETKLTIHKPVDRESFLGLRGRCLEITKQFTEAS